MARYCPPFSYPCAAFPGSAAAAACARGSGGRFAGRGGGGRERRGGGGRRRRAAGEKGCEGGGMEFTKKNPTALADEVWLRGTRLRSQSQRAALGAQSLSRPLRPFLAYKRKDTLPVEPLAFQKLRNQSRVEPSSPPALPPRLALLPMSYKSSKTRGHQALAACFWHDPGFK